MAKEEQIKTSIDLTGEREYRNACKAINSSLREIGSEMKLITAEFAGNADSTEALTKKQEVLQKSLDEQAKKAAAAEAALEKMRAAGVDPTSTAFQKMQTNLNNTKAEMVKTQAEIDGITASLNKTTPASEQFAAEAANVDKQLRNRQYNASRAKHREGTSDAIKRRCGECRQTASDDINGGCRSIQVDIVNASIAYSGVDPRYR